MATCSCPRGSLPRQISHAQSSMIGYCRVAFSAPMAAGQSRHTAMANSHLCTLTRVIGIRADIGARRSMRRLTGCQDRADSLPRAIGAGSAILRKAARSARARSSRSSGVRKVPTRRLQPMRRQGQPAVAPRRVVHLRPAPNRARSATRGRRRRPRPGAPAGPTASRRMCSRRRARRLRDAEGEVEQQRRRGRESRRPARRRRARSQPHARG